MLTWKKGVFQSEARPQAAPAGRAHIRLSTGVDRALPNGRKLAADYTDYADGGRNNLPWLRPHPRNPCNPRLIFSHSGFLLGKASFQEKGRPDEHPILGLVRFR